MQVCELAHEECMILTLRLRFGKKVGRYRYRHRGTFRLLFVEDEFDKEGRRFDVDVYDCEITIILVRWSSYVEVCGMSARDKARRVQEYV
jgi:hypothetical protein